MKEIPQPIASATGECKGPNGQLENPVNISLQVYKSKIGLLDCEKYIPEKKNCELGNVPCVWTVFDATEERKRENPNISCETGAGKFVFNSVSGEVVSSPLLPEKHDPVMLTITEKAIVEKLMEEPGEVRSHGELAQAYAKREDQVLSRGIPVHINRIRNKIGQERRDEVGIIQTVKARGYRMSLPPEPKKY